MTNNEVDILIVDDRIDGLITLEAVLTMPGWNLVKAQSGREALELLPLYDFGVILLDVQMPELDGFETAMLIRQHEKYKHTPIIFVTAINKDDRYIYRGYEAGAVDYIFKPFEPQILRSKVGIFVDLFLKSRQLQEQAEVIRESERRERYLRLTELEVESLKRYRNLADAIPHMVWRARADGTFDYFNKGWSDYTGLSQEQSLGTGWQTAIHPQDIDQFLKVWMQSMGTGRSFEIECRIRKKDGQMRWHWVKAVTETQQSGAILAWLGTCTDIHDRKLTETKLIDAERVAKSANVSKTSFLANMSHEIRTPMNAILGFTELMLDPDQPLKERSECIATVHRSGRQLLKIIDEILDISKVESGHLEIENVEVNIGILLADLWSLLQLQAFGKGLHLEFRLISDLPRLIYSDPTRLRQILLNLIGNAIKFTKAGNVFLDIEWKPAEDKKFGKLEFHISDTGVGIEPAQKDRLFQPFVQGDSSTTRHFGGTGLGLALSRQLAKAMGGDAFLESSELNKGSQFCVQIAVEKLEVSDYIKDLDFAVKAKPRSFPSKDEKKLKDVKVLLVEDVVDNQELMVHFLNLAGANVEVADNGKEGVRKALAGDFNVVLMDIQMPFLDGYEATKQLRNRGYTKPIIALTAHALKEERDRCLKAGCDDHLTKPIEYNVLIEQVAHVLQTH